jgi:hypothetical protein
MRARFLGPGVLLLTALAACAPALDWREVRLESQGLVAVFPCRPHRQERDVSLLARRVPMQMASCTDAGVTYAVTWVDVDDPAAMRSVLEALRHAAAANIGSADAVPQPFTVRGMTPNDAAGRIAVSGRVPSGHVVQEHAAFFTRGLRAYQATLLGESPGAAAVDGFFAGLAFKS